MSSPHRFPPLLAITMGDPAGIGPEIIVRAWRDPRFHALCRGVVVGSLAVMRRAAEQFEPGLQVVAWNRHDDLPASPDLLVCLDCTRHDAADVPAARIDPRGGQAAYDSLRVAAQMALAGDLDGLVTAPLHKAALHAAGHDCPGHTELLAQLCRVDDVAMMLYLAQGPGVEGPAGLAVTHVTLHMALRDVFAALSVERIVSTIRLADSSMRPLLAGTSPRGFEMRPRLAVAALNPHGGEQGLFGNEERTVILPAVEQAKAEGIDVTGPLPCDTLMVQAAAGQFDGVVAMYHDQGHIALKLLGMHRAVNITLGLPIVRTSVAHGTAFDLAWQGRAEFEGLIEAVRVAARLASGRSYSRLMNASVSSVTS